MVLFYRSATRRGMVEFCTAFTLLELLVTIACLAVVFSLLLPAISGARRKARDVGCVANLKEWGRATVLYANENGDRLPKDGAPNGLSREEGWYVELPKTIGLPPYHANPWHTNAAIDPGRSLWICPSNSRRSNGNNLFHYALNEHVNGTGSGHQADITSIRRPSLTVWIFDNGKLAAVAQQNNVHTNLHATGAHFLFLDAHVAHYPSSRYWDFSKQRGLTQPPDFRWIP